MKVILPILLMISLQVFAEGKYATVVINGQMRESKEVKTRSPVEVAVEKLVIDELGEKPAYRGGGNRVVSVSLIEQVAGPHTGKYFLDLSYISDPALIGPKNVTKDGLVIDAMRIMKAISSNKIVKSAKIVEVMLRPHVFVAGGTLEQLLKVQIEMSALRGPKWDGVTGAYFEELLRQRGKLNLSPFLIHNGGQFLILKPEQLDI